MKRTLEREVTVPEIAEKEANETACGFRDCIGRSAECWSFTVWTLAFLSAAWSASRDALFT